MPETMQDMLARVASDGGDKAATTANPMAAMLEQVSNDATADILKRKFANVGAPPPSAAADQPGTGPAPRSVGRVLSGYAQAIPGALNEAGSQLEQGVMGVGDAMHVVDPATMADVNRDAADQARRTAGLQAQAPGFGPIPGAGTLAGTAGAVAPLALGPAGLPIMAATQGGIANEQALAEGATRGQAALRGGLTAAANAALPMVARALTPAAKAVGAAVAKTLTPAVGDTVANRAGAAAANAVQGSGAGATLGGATAVGTAAYDTDLAKQRALEIPGDMGAFAGIGAAHGAATGMPVPTARTGDTPVDPSAVTQEMPPLPPETVAPWQEHGPINTEPLASPNAALRRPPTEEDIAAHQAKIDQAQARLDEIKRIRATGSPVVGDAITREVDPAAVRNAVDAEDAIRTQAEGAPDALMHRNADEAAPRVGDTQDNIKTQADARPWPRAVEETPTFNTDSLSPVDQGHIELTRMQAEAAKSQAIHDAAVAESAPPRQPKVSAGARYPGLPARDLELDSAQRAASAGGLKGGFYRDAQNRIVYDPQRQPAAVPPESAIPKASDATAVSQPQGRVAPEGQVPEGRQEKGGNDLQRGNPEVGSAASDPLREVAPSTIETKSAEPQPFRPGNRVRVDFKGQMVPGRVINRESPGRWKVQADDGRVFPAMVEARLAHDTSAPESSPAGVLGARSPAETSAARPASPAKAASLVPRLNAEGLRKQLDSLPINKSKPGLTDALMGIAKARADSAGVPLDDYIGNRIAAVEDHSPSGALNQRGIVRGPEVQAKRGAVQFLQDGRAIIRVLGQGNESTVLHELFHIFRRDLAGADLATLEGWAGVKDGKWTRAAEEKVARAGERYFRNGESPTPELKPVFQRFFDWLHNVYKSLAGSPINVDISPPVKRLFDRMFTPGAAKGRPEPTPAPVERAPNGARLANPAPEIQRGENVPYGAGTSKDASKVILDKAMPKQIAVGDKTIDPTPHLIVHEQVEKAHMDAGMPYAQAHEKATAAERSSVEAAGVDWNGYQAALKPHLDEALHRPKGAAPADLETKPYADSKEESLLKPSDDNRLGTANQRPDLATPGIDPEARKAAVEARNQIPDVAPRSRAEVRSQAQKRVDASPDGVLKNLTDKSARGHAWTAEDMGAAQILLDRLGTDPARAADHARLVMAYHLAGNEGAVALGMRADRLQTPAGRAAEARDLITMPVARVSRKLEKLRTMLREANQHLDTLNQNDPAAASVRARAKRLSDAIDRIEQQNAKRAAADKRHMKSLGFDMDAPDPEWAQDRDRFQQFIAALDATKGGLPAVMREYYIGVLHMSGTVFGKKIIADSLSLPAALIRRHLEVAVATAKRAVGLGKADEASIGELAAMWRALAPAYAKARANAASALLTEQFPKELMSPEDSYHFATIRGVPGKVLRHSTALTTVRAIDAFTRSLVAHVEVAGRAYRSAVDDAGKRLESDALERHMRDQVEDFSSDSWNAAREEAMRATFTEKPIEPVRWINRTKFQRANTGWGKVKKVAANALVPFNTIPSNIATQGLMEWTPGLSDAITVMKALRRDPETGEWAYDGSKFNRDVAQAILRWGSVATFGALAANGVITGSADPENKLSFNILGHHFSYRFMGPVSRAIGAAADWFGSHDPKKEGPAAERVTAGAGEQLAEMPLIRLGIDLVRAAGQKDGWTRFAADKSAGLVEPSIVRQSVTAGQDEMRHRTSFAKDNPTPIGERYLAYLGDRLSGNSGKPVVVNKHQLVKDSFDSRMGTMLWRVLSPFPLGTKEATGGEAK